MVKEKYVTIYFDLMGETDDEGNHTSALGDEEAAYREAANFLQGFTSSVQDEGHDEAALCCKFTLEKSRVPKLYEFIQGHDSTCSDGVIILPDSMFSMRGFNIMDDFEEPAILFENWEDWISANVVPTECKLMQCGPFVWILSTGSGGDRRSETFAGCRPTYSEMVETVNAGIGGPYVAPIDYSNALYFAAAATPPLTDRQKEIIDFVKSIQEL